ncbi:MAG: hypothetical protein ACRC0V_00270 [Fusobacteriaceae bacterium]
MKINFTKGEYITAQTRRHFKALEENFQELPKEIKLNRTSYFFEKLPGEEYRVRQQKNYKEYGQAKISKVHFFIKVGE